MDVLNVNPATPDPAPKGIAEFRSAPISSIGCADAVTAASAIFVMPWESSSPLPNPAMLALPLSSPAGGRCVRIGVNAQGDALAVIAAASASPSVAPSARTPSPSAPSALPNTSGRDDLWVVGLALAALAAILAAVFVLRRRGIPS